MKGRPPLNPRIEALEETVKVYELRLQSLERQIAILKQVHPDLPEYQPQFTVWPGTNL